MNDPKFKFELRPEDNKEITESFRGTIEKYMNDAMVKRWEMVESLMLLYMARTGFRPDQLELVEQTANGENGYRMIWTIRPIIHPGSETKITEEGKADPCHVRCVPSS
jgi:hypothetical protein